MRGKRTKVPARTAISDAMSKELKRRGFKFVGSTICYAFAARAVRYGRERSVVVTCFRAKAEFETRLQPLLHEPSILLGLAAIASTSAASIGIGRLIQSCPSGVTITLSSNATRGPSGGATPCSMDSTIPSLIG